VNSKTNHKNSYIVVQKVGAMLEVENFVTEFVKRIVENSIKDLIDKAVGSY
jgi:hypothetical protein